MQTLTTTMSMSSTKHLSVPRNLSFSSSKHTRLLIFHLQFCPNLSFPHKFLPKSNHFHQNQLPSLYPIRASTPDKCETSPDNQSEEDQEVEARDAVSEILIEFGVSKEESVEIASKCPKYVKMLMDSVRELDELSLWTSWKSQSQSEDEVLEGPLCFRRKVYYMAKEKGDNGKVALLESVGLSLLSAMNVGRYLSKETLSSLIYKVEYVKQMVLYDGDENEDLVGKKARLMLMHLSIPNLDDHVQQTLSFFEKIEAKRGGLDKLGSKAVSFQYLVESYPRLLLLSVESRMKPLVDYLEVIGVPRGSIRSILLLFPSILFYEVKDIKPRIQAFEKIGAVDNDFGRMLLKYPWILSTSIRENYKEIHSFFEIEKHVPKVNVDCAIKSWPLLLGCSTSKLNLMVEELDKLGIRNRKLGHVIATSPQILLHKPQEFLKVVSFFEDLGFDRVTIGHIIGRCPELFGASIEKTLMKKLNFLISIGISKDHLPRVIKKYPELFVSNVERTLLPRMKFLMKRGFSKRDIAFMVRKFSPILGYSIDKVLRPKLDFLVHDMNKSVMDAVEYPRYFSYSLEKKIKPRFWVLQRRKLECNLKDMLAKNDDAFATEYLGIERMLIPPPLSK